MASIQAPATGRTSWSRAVRRVAVVVAEAVAELMMPTFDVSD